MFAESWRMVRQILLMLVISVQLLPGQYRQSGPVDQREKIELTGDLRLDLRYLMEKVEKNRDGSVDPEMKSPLQAALFSGLLPGAGEFYVGDYWRGAAFLATEAALWIVYAVNDSRGDRQTRLFEQFADDHFSVVKYAEWMQQYATVLNPSINPADCQGIVTTSNTGLKPWERVDWFKLNLCEEAIGRKSSTGFSHRLPRRPDQQYYELIGKYEQYNPGWKDVDPLDGEANHKASEMFLKYRDMRGKANDFYNIATTFSYLLVANHIISALDAALLASQHNKHLSLKAHLQPTPREYGFIEFVPTAVIQIDF